jgi:inosose dehydratase
MPPAQNSYERHCQTNRLTTLRQNAPAATISIASAPVSWGIMESVEPPSEYPYSRVLDEIAKAGYAGTELGPYGFLPSDAAKLREELDKRSLTLCSAFVAIPLGNRAAHGDGLAQVLTTARLVSVVGCRLLILSDAISAERSAVAGHRDKANRLSWRAAEWKDVFSAVRAVLDSCREFGVSVAFHHHVGTHVETPEEVDRLLTSFSPSDLGLCLDTGHCTYGGGEPAQLLGRYADRIRCVHFKDIDGERLENARRQRLDFYEAVRQGVFAPLGQGVVNFAKILVLLSGCSFSGWIVVEQDVLAGGASAANPFMNAVAGREFLRTLGY